jgi:hypothetical protein
MLLTEFTVRKLQYSSYRVSTREVRMVKKGYPVSERGFPNFIIAN